MNKILTKIMKKNFLCVIGLACMAVACNSVVEEPVQYGEISVSLGEPEVEVITKAGESLNKDSDLAKSYTVSIFDKEVDEAKYTASYYDFATQKLPLGTYYVTAENCTEADAEAAKEGYGQMRLFGQSPDIMLSVDNISQTATVNCEIVNAKVSVEFADAITTENFENLQVVLSRTAPSRTVTVPYASSTTEVWFDAGSAVSYSITGTFKSGTYTKPVSLSGNFTLAAKNHVRIAVSVNLDNGQLTAPEITYDTVLNDPSTEDNVFNPYE